ncbi:hypothetical protein AUP68_17431 [Ilyonectria robusta]
MSRDGSCQPEPSVFPVVFLVSNAHALHHSGILNSTRQLDSLSPTFPSLVYHEDAQAVGSSRFLCPGSCAFPVRSGRCSGGGDGLNHNTGCIPGWGILVTSSHRSFNISGPRTRRSM